MLKFDKNCWEDYLYWQFIDKTKIKRINSLIKECISAQFSGVGKPEPLKGLYSGYWSRRIGEENRLIYSFEGGVLTIVACRFHY